jgi:hypothetical protein
MEQPVDERCAERCAALAKAVAECERQHSPSYCKPEFTRWRQFCVTNSACNPAGKQHDPLRSERRCAALAKRVAICEASLDGQARPSATGDCNEQRRRWRAACDGIVVHEQPLADPGQRSRAITDAYLARAGEASGDDQARRGGAFMRWLAAFLPTAESSAATRAAGVVCDHPAEAVVVIAGTLTPHRHRPLGAIRSNRPRCPNGRAATHARSSIYSGRGRGNYCGGRGSCRACGRKQANALGRRATRSVTIRITQSMSQGVCSVTL